MLFIYQGQETIYPPRLVLRRCGLAVIAAGPPAEILRAAFLLPTVSACSVAVFLVSAARMAAAKLIFGRGAESSIFYLYYKKFWCPLSESNTLYLSKTDYKSVAIPFGAKGHAFTYLVPDHAWENHCCDDLAVDLRLETSVVPVP